MLVNFRLTIFLGLFMPLFSCTKQDVSPEGGESPTIEPVYELIDMKYAMMDGDGIDTATLKLTGHEITNHGDVLTEQKVKINYDELVKKSLFEIDPSNTLPEGIVLDTFNVHVPSNWYGDGNYALYTTVFPLTAEEQEVPYVQPVEDVLTVSIPPGSRIVITAEIDAYTLKSSFRAVFKDRITGKQDTVTGKWIGTLRYNNSSIELKEHPLSGSGA